MGRVRLEENCIGYTFRKSQIPHRLVDDRLSLRGLLRHFQPVAFLKQADVIGVLSTVDGGNEGNPSVAHTAVRGNSGRFFQRVGTGAKVEWTSGRKVQTQYGGQWYEIIFLRKR